MVGRGRHHLTRCRTRTRANGCSKSITPSALTLLKLIVRSGGCSGEIRTPGVNTVRFQHRGLKDPKKRRTPRRSRDMVTKHHVQVSKRSNHWSGSPTTPVNPSCFSMHHIDEGCHSDIYKAHLFRPQGPTQRPHRSVLKPLVSSISG